MYMCPHKTHIVAITMFYILALLFYIFFFPPYIVYICLSRWINFPLNAIRMIMTSFLHVECVFFFRWGYYCGVMVNIIYDDVVVIIYKYFDNSFDASNQILFGRFHLLMNKVLSYRLSILFFTSIIRKQVYKILFASSIIMITIRVIKIKIFVGW